MRTVLWPSALVAALALTACGSVPEEFKEAEAVECPSGSDCYDPPRPEGPGGQLEVEAGEFYFEIRSGQAQEGAVEITLDNVGGADHTFTIDEAAGDEIEVFASPGETVTGTLELFAGTYTYYCSIPGHREAGMEGRLEVVGGLQVPMPDPGPTGEGPDAVASPTEPIGEEGAATPGEPGAEGGSEILSPPPIDDARTDDEGDA